MDLANEFKKLEEHFTKSMDAFNGRLKQAMTADKPEVRELYADYNSFKENVMQLLQQFKTIIVSMEQRIDTVDAELRKNKMLMHGIPESETESIETVVRQTLSTMKVNSIDISDNCIQECHRFGLPKPGASKKPRPIIINFNSYHHKQAIWNAKKNLKNTNVMITEFLTKNRLIMYNEAKKVFGNQKCWTTNGQIRVVLPDGKKTFITSTSQLEGYKRGLQQSSASGYSTRSRNK
nr:unnamed protein product [Callosobruchus analis]